MWRLTVTQFWLFEFVCFFICLLVCLRVYVCVYFVFPFRFYCSKPCTTIETNAKLSLYRALNVCSNILTHVLSRTSCAGKRTQTVFYQYQFILCCSFDILRALVYIHSFNALHGSMDFTVFNGIVQKEKHARTHIQCPKRRERVRKKDEQHNG